MNIKFPRYLIQSALILVFLWSCDAPRNNPLESYEVKRDTVTIRDTTEIEKELYVIDGIVGSLGNPANVQKEVLVSFNSQQSVITDIHGYFKLFFKEKNNGVLSFHKDSYHDGSVNISWGNSDSLYIEYNMDREPILEDNQFYSNVELEYYDQKSGYLSFNTKINDDNDGEINNIKIECAELSYSKSIQSDELGNYEILISEADLGVSALDEVIGKDFKIYTNYDNDDSYLTATIEIKRVLTAEVDFISPANQEKVTNSNPFFKWNRVLPGYDFNYILEVYTNSLYPELIWRSESISSEDISDRAGQPIPNGEYYWVIWVVDEFGNRIRSKPATFIVETDE